MRTLFMALLCLSGCVMGPSAQRHYLANDPAGAPIRVVLVGDRGEPLRGELLAADSAGIVVREGSRIVRVRPASIARFEVRRGPSEYIEGTPDWYDRVRARLARWSRYPQGIDSDLEAGLLAAYGTPAVEEIGP